MKTLFKYIFVCVALVVALTGCDDKHVKMPGTGGLDHSEQEIVGTYVGTWTSTNTTTNEVVSSTGSVIFDWNEELGNNVANVTIVSDNPKTLNLGAKSETSACNISKLSSGILSFWNVYKLNPFGFSFTGKVTPEGDVIFNYSVAIVVKHKETIYNLQFTGKKQ